jgi:hypothetical protein
MATIRGIFDNPMTLPAAGKPHAHAQKKSQMMLTHRIELDVANHHHFLVIGLENGVIDDLF